MTALYEAQLHHAFHYLRIAWEADELFEQGGEARRRGLELFDGAWSNLQTAQSWAARHAAEDEAAATLCSDYPNAIAYIIGLRLSPLERVRWLEAAVAASRLLSDRAAEAGHLTNLGNAYAQLGMTSRAVESHQQALNIYTETNDPSSQGEALNGLGVAYFLSGQKSRAVEFYERALAVHRDNGDRRGEGQSLGNLGLVYKESGDIEHAVELYGRQLAIAREIKDSIGEGNVLGNLGSAYLALGDTARAAELYRDSLRVARELGDRRGEASALFNISAVCALLGDRDEAIKYAESALGIFERMDDPFADEARRQLEKLRGGDQRRR